MDTHDTSANTTLVLKVSDEEAVYMDTILASGHLICVLLGIPINLIIILLIIVRRRLRRQPRNLIWIGIGVSNIFVLITNTFELIGYYLPEAEELCRIRFFLVGLPVACLLMNNILSMVDRYLAIFHPVWYRRCVTVRWVLRIQVVAFTLLFLLMKLHYILGLIQVKCNVVHPLDRAVFIGFIFFFTILCLFGQLIVYFMIKTYLVLPSSKEGENTSGSNNTTTNPAGAVPSIENIQQGDPTGPPVIDNQEYIAPEEAVRALGQYVEKNNSTMKKNLYFVRIRHEMVSRLELEATQNVILSVGLLLLFALPWIISSISALICHGNVVRQVMNDKEGKPEASAVGQCSPYYWAISYTRLILLIAHSI